MKITAILSFAVLVFSYNVQAAQWYMTCKVTEANERSSSSYMIQGKAMSSVITTGRQNAQLASPLTFEAFMKEKTADDTLTDAWTKIGDRQVVINVWQNGMPLSNIIGKEDALSITRFGGKRLTVGCFTFKK